ATSPRGRSAPGTASICRQREPWLAEKSESASHSLVKSANAGTIKLRSRSATIQVGSRCASTAAGAAATSCTAKPGERRKLTRAGPMSRNRQRAKQRQAERRAARLDSLHPDGTPREDTAEEREALEEEADLASGAPPTDLGRSGNTLEHSPHAPHIGDEEQIEEDLELEEALDEEFDETDGEEFDEVEFEARLDELDGAAPEGVS